MKPQRVQCLFFSPCGSVKAYACTVAAGAAEACGLPLQMVDLTLPHARQQALSFAPDTLTVAAFPVYAGRLPNRLLPDLQRLFAGGCGPAAALVVYGNRSPGDALRELAGLLTQQGFTPVAGAELVAQHAFAPTLAPGRPDADDLAAARAFGASLPALAEAAIPVPLPGTGPIGPYYQPLGLDGAPTVFLKAKPVTDLARCTDCGLCAQSCPVAAIDPAAPANVPGVCIKCQACLQVCPQNAKSWADAAFLSHKAALERDFTPRQESIFYPPVI